MGIIHRAFKVRIYPTQEQEVLINKTIGCSRFLYNSMLAEKLKVYEELKDRVFNCPSCGFEINRDWNAGINLKNYGLKELGLGQPDIKPVETLMHKVKSVKQEASKSSVSW